MKVILKEDVKKVGRAGEIVEVAEGYGRNFLIPKGLAEAATAGNLNVAKQKAVNAERKKAREEDESRLLASQLEKIEAHLTVRVGEGGRLFGSVTGKDVAEALERDHQIELDRRKITITPEVTGPGEYEATIKVHPKVVTKMKVYVAAQ